MSTATPYTGPFTYLVDDWLVLRTDANGHQACLVTELWPEWGKVGVNDVSADYLAGRKHAVLRVAKQLPESAWQAMTCANGWCAKCGVGVNVDRSKEDR